MSRFPSLTNLLTGTTASTPPAPPPAPDANTLDVGRVEAVMATEVDNAVAAANTRWNAVMTSDAGVANPKAAARMLMTSNMASADIVATLTDIAPAAAPTTTRETNAAGTDATRIGDDTDDQNGQRQGNGGRQQGGQRQRGTDQRQQRNDTNIDTGGSNGGRNAGGDGTGGGVSSIEASRERRKNRAERNNKAEMRKAGGENGVRLANSY